jgi:hypothetical protein
MEVDCNLTLQDVLSTMINASFASSLPPHLCGGVNCYTVELVEINDELVVAGGQPFVTVLAFYRQ